MALDQRKVRSWNKDLPIKLGPGRVKHSFKKWVRKKSVFLQRKPARKLVSAWAKVQRKKLISLKNM